MTRTRRLGALAAVLLGATALAACASGGSGSGSGSGGAISVDYMQSGTYDKAAHGLQPAFEKSTGTSVNIYAYPWATLASDNLNAGISGKCTYNVVSGSYYLAPIYSQMKSLDDLASKSGYSSQLIPGLWEHSEYYNGQHIGVPYGPDAYAPMYRTDLFRKAGLTPPKTWADLLADLPILKAKFAGQGIAPIVFGAGDSSQVSHLLYLTYNSYQINKAGHYALDPAAATTALTYGLKLLSYGPQNISGMSEEAADAAFTSGKAAILLDWPSFEQVQGNAAGSPIKGKWAVLQDPPNSFVYLSLWQMFMTACTQNTSAAWKWMTTFSSPSTDKTLFTQYGVNPSFKSTYDNPSIAKQYNWYLPATEANLARAENPATTTEAGTVLGQDISNAITGKMTPSQAVSAINQSWASLSVPSVLSAEAKKDGLVQS